MSDTKEIQIGAVSRPKPGEIECGDHYVIVENGDEYIIAVADGLGHGPDAAVASQAACKYISENSSEGLKKMLLGCSQAISHSRGAALIIIRINTASHELSYIGIGNVEMQSVSQESIRPVNVPGIVGRQINRSLYMSSHQLNKGDILAIFTDGISGRFGLKEYSKLDAQALAETILEKHSKDHDDATCVTIRY